MEKDTIQVSTPSSSRLAINMVIGAVFVVVGIMLGLWGQEHNPTAGFAERILQGPNQSL